MRGTVIHISKWFFFFQKDSLPGSFKHLAPLVHLESNLVYKSINLRAHFQAHFHCEKLTASFMGSTSAFPPKDNSPVSFQNTVFLEGKARVSWMFGSASQHPKHFGKSINIYWFWWGIQNQRGIFLYSCLVLYGTFLPASEKRSLRNSFLGERGGVGGIGRLGLIHVHYWYYA